ncbi:MAG: lipocalin family protein [Victivallales bacterium]|nr:lipocalin family protein [Victivallales bacterium]
MKRKAIHFFTLALMVSFLTMLYSCVSDSNAPRRVSAVENFDVERYMGTWYEIARLPQWFERNMINVKAEYTLLQDGTVKIKNTGVRDGQVKVAEGVARFKEWKKIGLLEVSFNKHFYSDYRIIRLADDYHYAVVTGKTKDSLWILSKKPQMPQRELDEILSFLLGLDFDISKLEYPSHRP